MAEFDQLLADRGRALHIGPGLQVSPGRAKNADDVHAKMIVKSRVFSRDKRVPHDLRHLFNIDPNAVFLGVQRCNLVSIGVIQDQRLLQIENLAHVQRTPGIQLKQPGCSKCPGSAKEQAKRKQPAAQQFAPPFFSLLSCQSRLASPHGGYFDRFVSKDTRQRWQRVKRPAVQQQQNARPQQLQQNSVEQSSQNAPPASLLSFAYAALVRCSAV